MTYLQTITLQCQLSKLLLQKLNFTKHLPKNSLFPNLAEMDKEDPSSPVRTPTLVAYFFSSSKKKLTPKCECSWNIRETQILQILHISWYKHKELGAYFSSNISINNIRDVIINMELVVEGLCNTYKDFWLAVWMFKKWNPHNVSSWFFTYWHIEYFQGKTKKLQCWVSPHFMSVPIFKSKVFLCRLLQRCCPILFIKMIS